MSMNTDLGAIQKCAAQHFGPWMIEPQWAAGFVSAIKAGTFKPDAKAAFAPPSANAVTEPGADGPVVLYYRENGIARVPFVGQVVKGDSSFGGASSVRTRKAMRRAANDDAVE